MKNKWRSTSTQSEKRILRGIVLSCPSVPKGPNPLLPLHTPKSLYTAPFPNTTLLGQFEGNQQIMGPRRKGGEGSGVSLLTMIDRNDKWIQTDTDICTHQAEDAHQHPHPIFSPHHPALTHLTWSLPIFLYIFSTARAFTSHKPSAWRSSNGEQKEANETKEFKNKHQEGHFTQVNTSNRVASARETKKHTANTPGLNTAPSLTQEVRQSLEKQREKSTGSLLALQRFPRVL